MCRTTLQRAFRLALDASGVKKAAHIHTLRHSYANEPANAADTTDVPARACAPLCPHCRKVMRRVGSWKAGQMLPLPNRPP